MLAGSEIDEAKGASREEKLKTAPLIPFCWGSLPFVDILHLQ